MVEARDPYAGITEDMSTLPDKVADALAKWKNAEVEQKREAARLYLTFKAKMAGDETTQAELKAMVQVDPTHYQLCLNSVIAESDYVRLSEKLMAAKRMASMRSAF